jgi:porin
VDQTVWQSASNSAQNVNVFGRIMGAPTTQNFISFFFNGGVTMGAPFPGRDNDSAGIDFGIGKVSTRASGLVQDSGAARPTTEELFELTYQAQVLPWLVVQPDIQYVVNPGGGVIDPNDSTHNLRNELVMGARVITTF